MKKNLLLLFLSATILFSCNKKAEPMPDYSANFVGIYQTIITNADGTQEYYATNITRKAENKLTATFRYDGQPFYYRTKLNDIDVTSASTCVFNELCDFTAFSPDRIIRAQFKGNASIKGKELTISMQTVGNDQIDTIVLVKNSN
jgi:hypothetical protein